MSTIMESAFAARYPESKREADEIDRQEALQDRSSLADFNQDDVYVINLRTRKIVERFGASSLHAQTIKGGGSWWVPLGCAVLTGLQAQGVLAT